MDDKSLEERDLIDLESGGSGCEEDTKDEPISGNRRAKNMVRLASVGLSFDGLDKGDCSRNSYIDSGKSIKDLHGNIELLIDHNSGGHNGEHVPLIEKIQVKEKNKMAKSKKAPKPPRPRKGPSFTTADLKLVKEISELALKKRARIERMKALKKMKEAKSSSSSSSNSSIFAMVVTLLFCLVIIFQGFSSGNSSTFQKSPGPTTAAAANGLISVQLYNNILESSDSPNSVEQTSSSEFRPPEIKLG